MHVCLIRLFGVAQCTNTSSFNKWYTAHRKHSYSNPFKVTNEIYNDKDPFVILRTYIILIMVGSCATYGYTKRKQKGSDISFFNFPHHNPELLQKWVQTM